MVFTFGVFLQLSFEFLCCVPSFRLTPAKDKYLEKRELFSLQNLLMSAVKYDTSLALVIRSLLQEDTG